MVFFSVLPGKWRGSFSARRNRFQSEFVSPPTDGVAVPSQIPTG
jgi:hypothetical protein